MLSDFFEKIVVTLFSGIGNHLSCKMLESEKKWIRVLFFFLIILIVAVLFFASYKKDTSDKAEVTQMNTTNASATNSIDVEKEPNAKYTIEKSESEDYKIDRELVRINAEYKKVMDESDNYWEDQWNNNKVYRCFKNVKYIKLCEKFNGLQNDVYFYYDDDSNCYLITIPDNQIKIYISNQKLLSYTGKDIEQGINEMKDFCDELIAESKNVIIQYKFERINFITHPEDAVEYNGHYYKKYANELGQREAEIYCEKVGGHLVFIEDFEEQAFIEKMIKEDNISYWIGGKCENEKEWYNGTKLMFDNAADDQINTVPRYLQIIGCKKSPNWEWLTNEQQGSGFICEWE